jgi:hypothetical protein
VRAAESVRRPDSDSCSARDPTDDGQGEMAERLKAPASKAGVGATPPGVQIPLSPWKFLKLRISTERDRDNMRGRVPPLGRSRISYRIASREASRSLSPYTMGNVRCPRWADRASPIGLRAERRADPSRRIRLGDWGLRGGSHITYRIMSREAKKSHSPYT